MMGTEKPSSRGVTVPKTGAMPFRRVVPENVELEEVEPLLATTITVAVSPGVRPVTSASPRFWLRCASPPIS